jgi:hypothetical protein
MGSEVSRERRSSQEQSLSTDVDGWELLELTCPRCGAAAVAIAESRDGGVYAEWDCCDDMCGLHGGMWTEEYSRDRGPMKTMPPVAIITLANLRLAAITIGVLLALCLHYSGCLHALTAVLR